MVRKLPRVAKAVEYAGSQSTEINSLRFEHLV